MKAIPRPRGSALVVDPAADLAARKAEAEVRAQVVALAQAAGLAVSDGTKEDALKAARAAERRAVSRAKARVDDALFAPMWATHGPSEAPAVLTAARTGSVYFMSTGPSDVFAGFWECPAGLPRVVLPKGRWRGRVGARPERAFAAQATQPRAARPPPDPVILVYEVAEDVPETPRWTLFHTMMLEGAARDAYVAACRRPEHGIVKREATFTVPEDDDPVADALTLLRERTDVVWCKAGAFATLLCRYKIGDVEYVVAVKRKWYGSEAKAYAAVAKAKAEGLRRGQWQEGDPIPPGCHVVEEKDAKGRRVWVPAPRAITRGPAGHWSRVLVQGVTDALVESRLERDDVARYAKPVPFPVWERRVVQRTRRQPGYVPGRR